ncbi:MAG TPA: phosphoribosylformylglycinamidine synthase subunit PurQ [Candidatus Binatia bacterium]|nr:phosphoribosylformylglycinamidine synthase subunit PurQ [Candidatus Binatia bacterium]
MAPNALVLTGYGINCDEETKYAFERAGANARVVHINDLIANKKSLGNYQIFAFPGGFSYGDDTGSGNALANKIRNSMWDELRSFIDQDRLMIGICNGFQVMVNLGLLPSLDGKYGERQVALMHNDSARYFTRWVDLEFKDTSVWTKGLGTRTIPIAHGEGKLYAPKETLSRVKVAARYVRGEICELQNLPANPNGSLDDIAGVQDPSGRVLGMMPHPERAMDFTQLPHWTLLKEQYVREGKDIPQEGPGLQLFRNGVKYFG